MMSFLDSKNNRTNDDMEGFGWRWHDQHLSLCAAGFAGAAIGNKDDGSYMQIQVLLQGLLIQEA